MIQAFIDFWKGYFDFSGRTTVAGYWYVVLVQFVIGLIFAALIYASPVFFKINEIYGIVTFIPGIAIFVRRMNDCGRSWTNIFWVFLPFVGLIMLIIRLTEKSVA